MSQDYRALVRDALRAGAGRNAGARPGADPAADPDSTRVATRGVELHRRVAGLNPLLDAANVLLALIPQLRATTSHPNPAELHAQLLARVGEFEKAAGESRVPQPKIVAARYVLCTFIDEVVAATPWGASGTWAKHNLLQAFHDERDGGEKSFKLLERLGQNVADNLDVLELFYVCVVLGFEGRYKGQPNARAQLDAIAARLAEVLLPPVARFSARTLSLRWTGVPLQQHRALTVVPVWAVLVAGAVIVLAALLLFNAQLNSLARPAFRQIAAVPATLRPTDVPIGSGAPAAVARLATPLAADLANKSIEVRDEALRSVAVLAADALFAKGTAQLEPSQRALIARVAQALAALPGQIVVSGHADNVPVSSLQFPSSWHLTRARANAVSAALVQAGLKPERVRAEGLADAEPRAANDDEAGRARNRRVEVVLQLPRPDAAP